MLSSKTNRNNRERGKAFEKKIADFLNWWRIPYSGSSELHGLGDVRDHEDRERARYLAECKSMTPRSAKEINYIIQEKWLVGKMSIIHRAKKGNKLPVLFFTKIKSPLSFAVIRDIDFKMFVEALDLLRQNGLIDDTTDVDEIRQQIHTQICGGAVSEAEVNTN
jgi:hypothetical protein